MYKIIFLAVVLNFLTCLANGQDAHNFVIKSYSMCKGVPNQKIQTSMVLKTFVPGEQLIDISLFTPIPLGNQLRLGISVDIEVKLGTKNYWQNLFVVEDDFCRIVQVYIGEYAYRLETAMGIPRGSCPILRGHYHAVNYTNDFANFKLQTFPFGRLKGTAKILEKSTRDVFHCSVAVISNNA